MIPVGATRPVRNAASFFRKSEMLSYEGLMGMRGVQAGLFPADQGRRCRAELIAYAPLGQRFLAILIDGFVIQIAGMFFLISRFLMTATFVVSSGPPIKTVSQESCSAR